MTENMSHNNLEQLFNEAFIFLKSGRMKKAENLLNQLLKINPNHPDVLHLLGVIALHSGNNTTAVNLIQKAITIQPETTFLPIPSKILSFNG